MTKRIEYMDIARGIGILLVVMGHNDFGYLWLFGEKLIYSFHMPLFFFLSGYFLNASIPFTAYIKKRFDTLIKPYVFTLFLIYFVSVSFDDMSFRTALQRIVKSLYASTIYIDWVQLWFLPHLFAVGLYAFLFFAIFGTWNRYLRWAALIVTLVVSSFFLQAFYPFTISVFGRSYELSGLPLNFDLVLLSGFFYMLGSEVRQAVPEQTFENLFLLIGSGVALVSLVYFFDARGDFATRRFDSYPINTAEAVLGIVLVLTIARQIDLHSEKLSGFFKYFGQISLFILLFHVPIQEYWGRKFFALVDYRPLSVVVGFIMGVGGSVLIYELFIKENPVASWWFGRKMESEVPSGTMKEKTTE